MSKTMITAVTLHPGHIYLRYSSQIHIHRETSAVVRSPYAWCTDSVIAVKQVSYGFPLDVGTLVNGPTVYLTVFIRIRAVSARMLLPEARLLTVSFCDVNCVVRQNLFNNTTQ